LTQQPEEQASMRNLYISLTLIFLNLACSPRFEAEITPVEIESHIQYLASEELAGRYPGSDEDPLLAEYIAGQLDDAGLLLHEKSGLQKFDIVTEIEPGSGNRLSFGQAEWEMEKDFTPLSFSSNAVISSELVFAGYGFQIAEEEWNWDDYSELDVEGKWVMILRGVPGKQDASSPYVNYSEDRSKALLAMDMGAAGVILVSGYSYAPDDMLEEIKGKQHTLSIPVIQITREVAENLLDMTESDSLRYLEQQLASDLAPLSFATEISLDASVDLQPRTMETFNSIAYLRGSNPSLRDEYVIVGAHHDHLGMGGTGTSSRAPDTTAVHYGADDNASGVAGVLEIAEKMVSQSPERSVMFTTFGAEEMGLVGSKYLVENSPVDLDKVQVMINLDMVGRLNEQKQVQIGGIGTSPGFEALLDSLNMDYGFSLKYSNEGYGPSDHAAFYAKDVPVLFISTGAHSDYHTPADNAAAINYEGASDVLSFVSDVAMALADAQDQIAFAEAGPKVRGSSRGRRGGITLGLMPDVTYDGSEGMPVMFVTEGKPAAVGGIQKGDVILSIEGRSVGNVYDYMSRLDALKEGMDIVVTVRRGEDNLELVVRI
jgi:aminopeptidase YwaD